MDTRRQVLANIRRVARDEIQHGARWRYRLLRNGERLGLYETANEAKEVAHD